MKHIILIPTYNESENIERLIYRINDVHPQVFINVIDDNSPDGTGKIVSDLIPNFPRLSLLSRQGKEGLGKAYIHAFREVIKDPEATHIIMMDADMSHDPIHLIEMIDQSKDFDLVIGSRYIRGGKTVGWELWRRLLSFFGNMYARSVTRTPVRDMTGGFNCISLVYLKKLDFDKMGSSGYAFIIELKYLLNSMKPRVKEIPITFVNRTGGESKISNHIISEGILAPWRMILKK